MRLRVEVLNHTNKVTWSGICVTEYQLPLGEPETEVSHVGAHCASMMDPNSLWTLRLRKHLCWQHSLLSPWRLGEGHCCCPDSTGKG
jgi:hypothetical protein